MRRVFFMGYRYMVNSVLFQRNHRGAGRALRSVAGFLIRRNVFVDVHPPQRRPALIILPYLPRSVRAWRLQYQRRAP